MKNNFLSILFLFLVCIQSRSFAGGTVVGNGGDPIFEFLEVARFSMIESLKVFVNDPAEQSQFCEKKSLTIDQVHFCRQYFSIFLTSKCKNCDIHMQTFFKNLHASPETRLYCKQWIMWYNHCQKCSIYELQILFFNFCVHFFCNVLFSFLH